MDLQKLTKDSILLFDGAMGTMLQQRGLAPGGTPEFMNITHPEVVTGIHAEYVAAGTDIIITNTFQANELKLPDTYSVEEVITAGVHCAKASGAKYVALDMGPLGQLMEPMGTISFQRAYDIAKRQIVAGAAAGADLVLIETCSDIYEVKAAVLAAKENSSLPVIATLTFQEDGRTFVGCDPLTAVVTLLGLGVDALGVNCSLGPKDLMPIVAEILRYSTVPVVVQANAGLPKMGCGQAVYDIGPKEYAAQVLEMVEMGVALVGGCCGTTPEYIRHLKEALHGVTPTVTTPKLITACTSGTKTAVLDNGITVIGERINPTGKKKLKEALRSGDIAYLISEAIDQAQAGCDALDVNVGLPELDEPQMLARVIREVQGVVNLPLQVDSSDPAAIEAGVRICNGKPIINSVNGKREVMEKIFPIAKKYGALVVGLTLDEEGIPPTAQGRLEIARRMLETALSYGIPRQDLLIDCLVLTASAQQEQVRETLEAIKLVKSQLGLKTVLGVSNVSFGLPQRELLNATFLAAAFGAGLDAPILNPLSAKYREVVDSYRVLSGEDSDAEHYIARYANQQPTSAPTTSGNSNLTLEEIILQGRKEQAADKVTELLQTVPPLEIIDQEFVPALNKVGSRFEKGELFLPQLMQSAGAVQKGFVVIKSYMEAQGTKRESRGKVLLATVQGDIHDIGKNIVRMMLENYGYDVVDLGKDVPVEQVVETISRENIRLAGLSALMTTTVSSMKDTIAATQKEGLPCTFFVGGAVLNPEYAQFVGAQHYARDAMESVHIANQFFG